jgi:predicted SnoaL-like aldol condensation-catalyzing enzyme
MRSIHDMNSTIKTMGTRKNLLFAFVLVAASLTVIGTTPAQQLPQPANPAPGCTATPAQLEANKQHAIQFYAGTTDARLPLISPNFKQHNPAFVKRAQEAHISDYDEFKATFVGRPAGAGRGPAASGTVQPPQGNQFEVVMAECDFVTVMHKTFRQDPTAAPGTFYEADSFDIFRVGADGKFVEHWDAAVINPPAATPTATPVPPTGVNANQK